MKVRMHLNEALSELYERILRIGSLVEDFALRVIALEQPVATDLRELITATKIASELERIGDHARHFARLVNTIPQPVMHLAVPTINVCEWVIFGRAGEHVELNKAGESGD